MRCGCCMIRRGEEGKRVRGKEEQGEDGDIMRMKSKGRGRGLTYSALREAADILGDDGHSESEDNGGLHFEYLSQLTKREVGWNG